MLAGKRAGLSYEEMRAEALEDIAAIENWIGLVNAAARRSPETGHAQA
jgi:hypothetical protein